MGLTIVHKSDLTTRKKNPRVALVLAGGAVTGGAYKLGGLKALDDFLVNRKTTDFDIYVGLSAGAFPSSRKSRSSSWSISSPTSPARSTTSWRRPPSWSAPSRSRWRRRGASSPSRSPTCLRGCSTTRASSGTCATTSTGAG